MLIGARRFIWSSSWGSYMKPTKSDAPPPAGWPSYVPLCSSLPTGIRKCGFVSWLLHEMQLLALQVGSGVQFHWLVHWYRCQRRCLCCRAALTTSANYSVCGQNRNNSGLWIKFQSWLHGSLADGDIFDARWTLCTWEKEILRWGLDDEKARKTFSAATEPLISQMMTNAI